LIIICIGSEKHISKVLCQNNECIYYEHPNKPLSKKWGYGMKLTKKYDADGVITIGSDDLISKQTFYRYISAIDNNESFLGFYDIYFYSKKSSLIHWHGYGYNCEHQGMPRRLGETIGAGRFYSKDLLEIIDYNPWDNIDVDCGLDLIASNKLESLGILKMDSKHSINNKTNRRIIGQFGEELSNSKSLILDIKTDASLTPISRYTQSPKNAAKISEKKEFLLQHFQLETVEQIFQITTKHPNQS
jgi:hypothetical protein